MSATQRAINEAKRAGYTPSERGVFLDPLFWRAVGRARKWDEDERDVGARADVWTSVWLRKWHEFVDHLAFGRGIEQYFEKLEKEPPRK
jgi:hypothetical protein